MLLKPYPLRMQKAINNESIKVARAKHGMAKKQLAESVDVFPQAVTNWLKGKDFPRPATLLKLAKTLQLTFDQIVQASDAGQPVVAFRKKGNAKTNKSHIAKAEGIGMLLKPLAPYLPELQVLRTLITSPSTDYSRLEDFKFRMAHELAHVYTPELTGSDEGEDYADTFAGALLFPNFGLYN